MFDTNSDGALDRNEIETVRGAGYPVCNHTSVCVCVCVCVCVMRAYMFINVYMCVCVCEVCV